MHKRRKYAFRFRSQTAEGENMVQLSIHTIKVCSTVLPALASWWPGRGPVTTGGQWLGVPPPVETRARGQRPANTAPGGPLNTAGVIWPTLCQCFPCSWLLILITVIFCGQLWPTVANSAVFWGVVHGSSFSSFLTVFLLLATSKLIKVWGVMLPSQLVNTGILWCKVETCFGLTYLGTGFLPELWNTCIYA